MAKIENTTVYPTVLPAASDLLIATDVSNDNKTVTFLVSDVVGGGGVAQDLQSVLTTGNIAVENINLTGAINVIGTVYPTTITAIGSTGTAGQILSSTNTGIQWIDSPSTSCCTWNDSLISGNISTTKAIVDGVAMEFTNAGGLLEILSPAELKNSGTSTFTGEVRVNGTDINFNATGQINDGAGNTGTPGQWLTVDAAGTGLEWSSAIPAASCCNIQDVLGVGFTALNQGISFTGTSSVIFQAGVSISSAGTNIWGGTNTFTGILDVDGCLQDSLSSCGVAGQVLISTGTSVQWSTGAGLGAQDLQGVLDTGNSATGANASITISGTINPGTITDSSGGTGITGQVLSMSGSGLSWTTAGSAPVTSVSAIAAQISSGTAITITPTVGLVTVQPNYFAGGTNVGHVPDSSAANQTTTYLRADGSWETPTGAGLVVTSITSSSIISSVGEAITVNAAATGAVIVNAFEYDGDTNIGYVPRGSGNDAAKYLDGTGNWTAPAGSGSGVTGITGTSGTSTGIPLGITPSGAGGSVNLTSFAYAGGIKQGHVPSGSGDDAAKYLDGTGNWTAPAGSLNSYTETFKCYAAKLSMNPSVGNTYHFFNNTTSAGGVEPAYVFRANNVASPTGGTWLVSEQFGAFVFGKSLSGCGTSDDVVTLCSAFSMFQIDTIGTYIVEIWKANVCAASPVLPVLYGEITFDVAAPLINKPVCKEWNIAAGSTLVDEEFIFMILRSNTVPTSTEVNLILTCSFQNSFS